jgi:glycosyltransferase involved in cell wall biosynthesis
MRVLVEQGLFPHRHLGFVAGGCEMTVNHQVQALRAGGHEVTFVLPPGSVHAKGDVLARQEDWPRVLSELGPTHDVVFCNTPTYLIGLDQAAPEVLRKIMMLDHAGGSSEKRVQERRALRARGVTYLTCDAHEELVEYDGRCLNVKVPNDLAALVPHDPKRVIAIGANARTKHMDVALEVIKTLEPLGYTGTIFSSRQFDARVRVGVPHAEIMQELARSACILQPTSVEKNGGNVTFEAAAHGVPVIHRHHNADYFLVPSSTGRRVDEENLVENMVQAVLKLEQPDRAVARAYAAEHYSTEKLLARLEHWLEHVTKR